VQSFDREGWLHVEKGKNSLSAPPSVSGKLLATILRDVFCPWPSN